MGEAVDIYATKGVEYLIVLGYLLVLVGLWVLLSPKKMAWAVGMRSRPAPARAGQWFTLRQDYFYHQGHSWAAAEDGDVVTIGVDDFAQRLLGRPDAIHLPQTGARVQQGELAWDFEVDGRTIGMLSPVDGKVLSVNRGVVERPDLLAESPYERGWLLKVRVPKPRVAFRNLLTGDLSRSWMSQVVERLRRMQVGELGVVMPDGGVPVPGFVRQIDPEHWDAVAREFLLTD
ncbi:MAG: glycine cleavage system protein H [Gemmatimonadales bacterium]|jgi:glycine cleavage system H lipoate-binding protein|nr:glycine cleavage system protein H [Gemmatimonadales bacterium]